MAFTAAVVTLGYVMLGLMPMLLFALGFVGGLGLWLLIPKRSSFTRIKVPYFVALGLFIVHKLEERYLDFFPALSQITGVPTPPTDSVLVYLLYALAACWLLIPWLVSRSADFGYFLAWTFFTSLGVIELAHFVFPFFRDGPYGYFPGMASVVLLAPAAWWGMWRLSHPPAPSEA
ncbi:MAG: hypothetical protein AB7I36_17290 [Rhodospirillaceae bacterium]